MSEALAIGLSHSPLKAFVVPEGGKADAVAASIDRARQRLKAFAPDLAVVFFPDHFNGFFHDLMPPFCIGAAGAAIGDYNTLAGPVRIDEKLAEDCAQHVLDQGIDLAVSYRMVLDHGLAQPMEELFGALDAIDVLPVFVNSVAPPFAPIHRVTALGRAVGDFLAASGRRVAYIGSGGLSHDPPLPRLGSATPEQREMLMAGRNLSPVQRNARQERVISAGRTFAQSGGAQLGMRDLNPEWDRQFMARLGAGDFGAIEQMSVSDVKRDGGNSAHEVRAWLGAFAALGQHGAFGVTEDFYTAIPEWIVGFGTLVAETQRG